MGLSNQTRGVFGGRTTPGNSNTIDYITIASTGDAQDFGDTIDVKDHATTASNAVRIVYFHGQSNLNSIEFVTTATLGNAVDFGDMTLDSHYGATSISSATRGCIAVGWYNYVHKANKVNEVQKIVEEDKPPVATKRTKRKKASPRI